MSNSSRYISSVDNNTLFSRSAGQCNKCKANVPDIAERAHIIAHSKKGARGNSIMEGNNSYENLILLCPNCHSEVDKYPERFPPEELFRLKKNHEEHIQSQVAPSSQQRKNDICCIQQLISYGNICLIPSFIEFLPHSVDIRVIDFCNVLNELRRHPAIYPLSDDKLQSYLNNFIIAFDNLWFWIAGSTPEPNRNFEYQHFSQAEGNPPSMRRLYEGISYERNQEIDSRIQENVHELLKRHNDLIQYIRACYSKEVNLLY